MKKQLMKLKSWLTLHDSARHLSGLFDDTVTEADILQFALDGQLKLSVSFVNRVYAKQGKRFPRADVKFKKIPSPFKPGELIDVSDPVGPGLNEHEILVLEREITGLEGVWDLPLLGEDRIAVERAYQELTNGPEVTMLNLEGAFVEAPDGSMFQLQERFDKEGIKPVGDKKDFYDPSNFFPGVMPEDCVFVVRTSELTKFEEKYSSRPLEKPFAERERTTLLVIIAALSKEAKLDISRPSKAAASIEALTEALGARVAARTIEDHLNRVSDALERKTR